ncbi:MAG: hypothetical protein LBM67_01505 [Lentimicrobiaceae bacterium]|nr:hypothetical protein [Lentimicrobiaceae bacterium]
MFRNTKAELLEITLNKCILLYIIELLTKLSDIMSFDIDIVMKHLLSDNERFVNLFNFAPPANAA